jgi:hypothetical protein
MGDGTEKLVSREINVASNDDRNALLELGLRSGERVAQGAFDLLAPNSGGKALMSRAITIATPTFRLVHKIRRSVDVVLAANARSAICTLTAMLLRS